MTYRTFSALGCVAGLTAMTACGRSELPLSPVAITADSTYGDFSRIGEIAKVVSLESVAGQLLGGVTQVRIDGPTGDIMVLDATSTRSLYRFSATGQLRRRYPIPSQASLSATANGFVMLQSGEAVVCVGRRLIVLSDGGRNGQFHVLPFIASDIATDGALLFLSAAYRDSSSTDDAVHVFDAGFSFVRSFHAFDARLDRYRYMPRNRLALIRDRVFVADVYSPTVSIYTKTGEAVKRVLLDPEPVAPELEAAWRKPKLTSGEERMIQSNTRRFWMVHPYGDKVFLYERHDATRLHRLFLMNQAADQVRQFDGVRLLAVDDRAKQLPVFDQIVGSFDDGLVMVSGEMAGLQRLSSYTTIKAALTSYRDSDNPLLMFLRVTH